MKLRQIRDNVLKGDFSDLFNSSNTKLKAPPSEIARILSTLSGEDVMPVFNALPDALQIAVFRYLDILVQKKIIFSLSKERASSILNSLHSDDRMSFYSALRGPEISKYLEYLDEKKKNATHDLLGYPDQSVARLVNTHFASIPINMTVAQASEHLRNNFKDVENINVAYILDSEGKLLDDIPIRRLVLSDQNKKMDEIMDGFCAQLQIKDSADDA